MNIKLYTAARAALQAKAVESLALIDVLLNNPTMVPDHSSLVDEITKHARLLAEYEGAMITLEQYFGKKPAPKPKAPAAPPTPAPTTPSGEGPSVTEEQLSARSTAYRNSPPGKKKAASTAKKRSTKKND
jgi:hypothetical protein